MIECINALCSSNSSNEEAHLVALEALLPAHHPKIVLVAPDLWIKILRRFKLDPKQFVAQHASTLRKILITDYNGVSLVSIF